ncbi:hypothetical protein [Bradyrhizobium glycinis]|uniref:hypothetical protein n=1 Tax=Bradyrhizobium glycinis TaxID=2751812 RepID=UPI0018D9568D|nr:hypothetical protein [Bradyrhizobium glycinis]MBH5367172.1 hypothetical protein [Bradyrhizobium glycinis]
MNNHRTESVSRRTVPLSVKLDESIAQEIDGLRARILAEQSINLSTSGALQMLLRRGLAAVAAERNTRS